MSNAEHFPRTREFIDITLLDEIKLAAGRLLDYIDATAYHVTRDLEQEIERAHRFVDQTRNALQRGSERYDLNFYCVHLALDETVSQLIREVRELRSYVSNHLRNIFQLIYDLIDAQLSIYTFQWRIIEYYRPD